MKRFIKILSPTLLNIILLIGLGALVLWPDDVLDTVFNHPPKSKAHTEIMLWHSENPKFIHELGFDFEVIPRERDIKLVYRIKNPSDGALDVGNSMDIAFIDSDFKSIGDPGTILWRWSESNYPNPRKTLHILPHKIYEEERTFDRSLVKLKSSQYYVSFYFDNRFLAQFKIIEGIYDK